MINLDSYNIKIDCAFPISWKKGVAYAQPREFDAISFRVNGNAVYRHKNEEYCVSKNDILFVPANYGYEICANRSEEVFVIHFYIENSDKDKMQVFTPTNPDVFERLFSEIVKTWRTKATGYRYKTYSLFYKILQQMEIQTEQRELVFNPKRLQLAVDYIHENFDNPQTTVEAIARHVGTSSVYLRKLFRNSFNKNPLQYLTDIRLEHALSLLKTGYYSIGEVAVLSGFNDAKYFSSLYKKKMGVCPSENYKKISTKQ